MIVMCLPIIAVIGIVCFSLGFLCGRMRMNVTGRVSKVESCVLAEDIDEKGSRYNVYHLKAKRTIGNSDLENLNEF